MHGETKPTSTLATQLHRIATRSAGDFKAEYGHLMALYSKGNLADCFDALDGRKAVGVDGKTKTMYGQELTENLAGLVHRMKRMSYRPQPVREVLIPKGHGKYRPLGLSVVEDKVVQSLTGKILEAIYEPLFRESSFGFRQGRSARDLHPLFVASFAWRTKRRILDCSGQCPRRRIPSDCRRTWFSTHAVSARGFASSDASGYVAVHRPDTCNG